MTFVARVRAGTPDEIVGPDAYPYMLRWFVFPRVRHLPRLYLHKFVRSDEDRALHDHPWNFVSLILKGRYWEHTEDNVLLRKPFSVAYRRAEHAHRVQLTVSPSYTFGLCAPELKENPVWTLVMTGPKRREWGFHCPQGWRHWKEFVGVRGCD